MSSAPLSIASLASPVRRADDSHYRPVLFRRSVESDQHALAELERELGGALDVRDAFRQQLEGLVRSRRPRRAPSRHELDAEVVKAAAGRPLAELGVWVYYPWRTCLVHLLDEADFIELRTSRNRYKITGEEQALLAERKVGIVGLSVGGQVALTMATERICGELRLADFDTLELSNLNRLREGVMNLGLQKTTLAARAIAELDPFIKVTCYDEGLTLENLDAFLTEGGQLDVLVEECDGLAMKLRCRERARELGIPVVMEANDRATLDIERFDREPGRPLLHGLLAGLDLGRIGELRTNDEKVPYLMPMVGETTMSDKLRASLLEVGESIETWPQLASDVVLGAGLVTNVVRRMALGTLNDSGRHFVDLEELVRDRPPVVSAVPNEGPASGRVSLREAAPAAAAALVAGQCDLPDATLDALIAAAVRAPSGGNEQPWRWAKVGAELWLLPARPFGDSLLNYRDNATFIALGAAAENVVLRAHALGLDVTLEAPAREQARPACRFKFFARDARAAQAEAGTWDALVAHIDERHTNRRRVAGGPVAPELLDELTRVVTAEPGFELTFATQRAAIAEVAEVAARADRIRMLHPQGHRDFVREIRWTREENERERDGIDLATLDLSAAEHAGLRMLRSPRVPELLRSWQQGHGLEKLTRSALTAASAVGLVTAPSDSIRERFVAGRVVQRAWLTATRLGLALQPHTSALFLFARALGGGEADFEANTMGELLGLQARLRGAFKSGGAELFLFRVFPGCAPLGRSLRRAVVPERAELET